MHMWASHWVPFVTDYAPAGDRTGDPSIYSRALYHVAIKAGLFRKAVQVYNIPKLYPVTKPYVSHVTVSCFRRILDYREV